ncbi:HPF/RaiA family ribosome-associated protein [Patescibacteria group bacterium]|nr:HPF/RaiA family ribosome-associated protein [Patescibacteria group bacterium]
MEIHFKTPRGKDAENEISGKTTEFAERKIRNLKKYLGKEKESAQVYVELGKDTEAHASGNIWRAMVNLDSHGKRYHADATGETIEAAIDVAVRELEAELRKAKQRRESLLRKGGGALKAFMRGFGSR